MLYYYLTKILSKGRTFATEKDLTVYLNRVTGYMKGRKKLQRTTAAHKGSIIKGYKVGKLPGAVKVS